MISREPIFKTLLAKDEANYKVLNVVKVNQSISSVFFVNRIQLTLKRSQLQNIDELNRHAKLLIKLLKVEIKLSTLVLVELHVREHLHEFRRVVMSWLGLPLEPADLQTFKLDQKRLVSLCLSNREKIKFKSGCFLLYVDNTRVHVKVKTTSSIN